MLLIRLYHDVYFRRRWWQFAKSGYFSKSVLNFHGACANGGRNPFEEGFDCCTVCRVKLYDAFSDFFESVSVSTLTSCASYDNAPFTLVKFSKPFLKIISGFTVCHDEDKRFPVAFLFCGSFGNFCVSSLCKKSKCASKSSTSTGGKGWLLERR